MKKSVRSTISIFKPGVLLLLVLSAATAMVLAGGLKTPSLFVMTLVFGGIAGASANILNNYIDRDIDSIMDRTKNRPIPAGRIRPNAALLFGIVLAAVSVALFWLFINTSSALLALFGIGFYFFIYSMVLKKRTEQNIVLGGAAGIFPALVGWTAVTSSLAVTPLLIGLLIIFWTPPHFWSLAIIHKDDYRRARIPMMPSVVGAVDTARQIMVYTIILVIFTVLLGILGDFGFLYMLTTVALGVIFLIFAVGLLSGRKKDAKLMFHYSNLYLIIIFVVMIIDSINL